MDAFFSLMKNNSDVLFNKDLVFSEVHVEAELAKVGENTKKWCRKDNSADWNRWYDDIFREFSYGGASKSSHDEVVSTDDQSEHFDQSLNTYNTLHFS